MDSGQQLMTILIVLASWSAITTILLILTRRDVKLGFKKWFYLKRKMQPLKVRYHGPDKNVVEDIIPMKGKGEVVTLFEKRMIFFKNKDAMKFFMDEGSMRRCDDGINELSFNYKTVTPIDPTKTMAEIEEERQEYVRRRLSKEELEAANKENEALLAVDTDQLVRYTDPKRLNKFVEYTYLAAKADALAAATDMEKWVKIGVIGTGIVLIGVIAVYYTIDGKVLPLLQQVAQTASTTAAQVLHI